MGLRCTVNRRLARFLCWKCIGSTEQIAKETTDLKIELAAEPVPPSPPYEPPIEDALNQMPLFPRPASDMVIKVLKEILWSPVDIGNFLRANLASFDFSFWRQQAPLIVSHPLSFVKANIKLSLLKNLITLIVISNSLIKVQVAPSLVDSNIPNSLLFQSK